MLQILITEFKSHGTLSPSNTVRVFVDRDYHYGYWVPEDVLYALLTTEQQAEYLGTRRDVTLRVSRDVAQRIINAGETPYKKVQLQPSAQA